MKQARSGRPKNGEINETTVARLRRLREEKGDKQEVIARSVLRMKNSSQYGRYERGETAIPDKYIVELAAYYRVPPDFIRGYTDVRDPIAYSLEWQEAEYAGAAEYFALQRAERTRRINFFDFCGFHYEDLAEHPGPLEFAGLEADASEDCYQKHKIVDPSGAVEPIALTDDELNDVLESVHSCIAFECFKLHLKRRELSNGDHREDLQ